MLRHVRWIHGRHGRVVVAPRGAFGTLGPGHAVRPGAPDVNAWLNDPTQRPVIVDLLRRSLGVRVDLQRADLREYAALLTRAFESGDLRARRMKLPNLHRDRSDEPPEQLAPTEIKKKTWIAIEVVDDRKPPRPVAGLRWRITLPDGEVREGRTDDKGKARIEGIEEGVGEVTFPDLDAKEWRPL